jgi:hypothetical protein
VCWCHAQGLMTASGLPSNLPALHAVPRVISIKPPKTVLREASLKTAVSDAASYSDLWVGPMIMQAAVCLNQANIGMISGFYAQLTGVLAGFAFTALVVLMTPTQVDERSSRGSRRDQSVLLVLLAAFIALIITTLTYSVLAGLDISTAKGLEATLELTDGVPFGLAVMMLFQGVTLLMESGNPDRVAVWAARVMTVVLVPSLAYYYLISGTQDTLASRAGNTLAACTTEAYPDYSLELSIALPVLLTVSLMPWVRLPTLRHWAGRLQSAAPVLVLVASMAAAVTSGDVIGSSAQFLLSPRALAVYIDGTFALFAVLGILLAMGYPQLTKPAGPEKGTTLQPTVAPDIQVEVDELDAAAEAKGDDAASSERDDHHLPLSPD